MLVLSRRDVESLLDLEALVAAVAAAMAALSTGRASVPPRVAAVVERSGGLLGAMPACLPGADVLEAKLVSLFPGKAGTAFPTHQAAIVSSDPSTGAPVASMDAEYITEVRTAAGSARLLAREDARVLAVLATGVQARAHARRCQGSGRSRKSGWPDGTVPRPRRSPNAWRPSWDGPVRVASSYEKAMDGADITCACTHSSSPVVRRGAVALGMHITSGA
jgi:alanine dehydrogenase